MGWSQSGYGRGSHWFVAPLGTFIHGILGQNLSSLCFSAGRFESGVRLRRDSFTLRIVRLVVVPCRGLEEGFAGIADGLVQR